MLAAHVVIGSCPACQLSARGRVRRRTSRVAQKWRDSQQGGKASSVRASPPPLYLMPSLWLLSWRRGGRSESESLSSQQLHPGQQLFKPLLQPSRSLSRPPIWSPVRVPATPTPPTRAPPRLERKMCYMPPMP